jgi:hypothetical protein
MRVRGLDGREYPWDLTGRRVNEDDTRPRSSLHLAARALLSDMYKVSPILEEVPLPGTGSLRADFYLPHKKMMIEVHGEQHYTYNKHFHGNKTNFIAACKRDVDKKTWCHINNIKYISLPYNEDVDVWRNIISEG